jgi:hypothetical protein
MIPLPFALGNFSSTPLAATSPAPLLPPFHGSKASSHGALLLPAPPWARPLPAHLLSSPWRPENSRPLPLLSRAQVSFSRPCSSLAGPAPSSSRELTVAHGWPPLHSDRHPLQLPLYLDAPAPLSTGPLYSLSMALGWPGLLHCAPPPIGTGASHGRRVPLLMPSRPSGHRLQAPSHGTGSTHG